MTLARPAVVLGPCDDMRAEVFVSLPRPPEPRADAVRLTGTLTGPQCRLATTLPTTARLIDMGPPASPTGSADREPPAVLVARAVLTEPSFWTPELPNLYRLDAHATADGRTVASCERLVGLRRLGVRGRSFWFDGRRWVPRGVACTAETFDAGRFRGAGAAAVVADPPETLCAEADEAGVAIVALLAGSDGQPFDAMQSAERIATWAAHPSVVASLMPSGMPNDDSAAIVARARRLKGTLLLGREVDGLEPPPAADLPACDFLGVSLPGGRLPHAAWRAAAPRMPLVAWRHDVLALPERRPACDALQAALAAWGLADGADRVPWEWAGYAVG